jgi:hypothetical protein
MSYGCSLLLLLLLLCVQACLLPHVGLLLLLQLLCPQSHSKMSLLQLLLPLVVPRRPTDGRNLLLLLLLLLLTLSPMKLLLLLLLLRRRRRSAAAATEKRCWLAVRCCSSAFQRATARCIRSYQLCPIFYS